MRSKRKNKVSKGRLRQSKVRKTSLRKNKRTQRRKSKKYSQKTRRSFIKKSRKNNRKLKGGAADGWLQRELAKPNATPELQQMYEFMWSLLENLVGSWQITGSSINLIKSKLSDSGEVIMEELIFTENINLDDILQMSREELFAKGFNAMDRKILKEDLPTETESFTIWKDADGLMGLKGSGRSGTDIFTLENIRLENAGDPSQPQLHQRLEDNTFSMEQVYSDGLRNKWLFNILADGNNLVNVSCYAAAGPVGPRSPWVGIKIGNFTGQRRYQGVDPEAQKPGGTDFLNFMVN